VVVSEPLGDLPGASNEVAESHVRIVQPGEDALLPFSPGLQPGPPPAGVMGPHPRQEQSSRVEIGEPQRTYTVEPIEDPVPRETPPDEEPVEPRREPEEVPGR
jgi:hypothetical protein